MEQARDCHSLWKQVHHNQEDREEEVKFAQSGARIRNRGNGLLIFEPRDSPQSDETVVLGMNQNIRAVVRVQNNSSGKYYEVEVKQAQ